MAADQTEAIMRRWWSAGSRMFRDTQAVAETVPSDPLHDHGYTLWPSLIALHALVAGERHTPGQYAAQIAHVFDGLGQYDNPQLHAYTAWLRFPGNIDAYYDDNAWAVIVLTEAHLACRAADPAGAKRYLARAHEILTQYLIPGYDSTGHPGGMPWGSDPAKPHTSDRGTSSTAGTALAALMMARAGVDAKFHASWGRKLLDWLSHNLQDTDGLIMDALEGPDWKPRRIKWTYNTGVPMRAYIEHYRLTRSADSLKCATRLAHAALNRQGRLFDLTVQDPQKRDYWDETYFVHYLADGLQQVALTTPDPDLAAACRNAVVRSARFMTTFLRDPQDGFYWRNWRLYAIGETQRVRWERWTGQKTPAAYDASERSQDPQYQQEAVSDRPLVKTLLANAGAARLLWIAADVPAKQTKQNLS